MLDSRAVLEAAGEYLRKHPEEIGRAVRGALGLRIGVPLVALRWLTKQLLADKEDTEVRFEARPPGIRVGGIFEAMETKMDAGATIFIDRVKIDEVNARIDLRLEDIDIKILSEKKTQISALIRSGALDVSNVGDLINELPDIPDFILDAKDNKMSIDLMLHPQLKDNPKLRQMVGALSSLVTLHGVYTDDDHLDIKLRAFPRGLFTAAEQVGDNLVEPGLRKAREVIKNGGNGSSGGSRWRRMLSLMSPGAN